jgi:hypothetical protein
MLVLVEDGSVGLRTAFSSVSDYRFFPLGHRLEPLSSKMVPFGRRPVTISAISSVKPNFIALQPCVNLDGAFQITVLRVRLNVTYQR